MAYNPFDDEVDNDPAYQGIDEDPRTKALDITLNIPMRRPPPVPKFISEGRDIRRRQDQLERINNLKFPNSAYQYAAETLAPPEGEELDEYNNQFYTKPRFTGLSVGDVGKSIYGFLGKGTGPEVQEQMDLNKEILNSLDKEIIIMHPGPINRGVEITSEVADSEQAIILDQVENGVAIRMSVMYLLASKLY